MPKVDQTVAAVRLRNERVMGNLKRMYDEAYVFALERGATKRAASDVAEKIVGELQATCRDAVLLADELSNHRAAIHEMGRVLWLLHKEKSNMSEAETDALITEKFNIVRDSEGYWRLVDA